MGEDWNGLGGGNSDLGDPVYSIGHGVVVLAGDMKKGWGNTVIIRHAYRGKRGRVKLIDSFYTHLHKIFVKKGQIVEKGKRIGSIGNNRGMYWAHLHFEIRKNISIGMNRSKFKKDYSNYYSPSTFIKSRRKLKADTKKYKVPIDTFGK